MVPSESSQLLDAPRGVARWVWLILDTFRNVPPLPPWGQSGGQRGNITGSVHSSRLMEGIYAQIFSPLHFSVNCKLRAG